MSDSDHVTDDQVTGGTTDRGAVTKGGRAKRPLKSRLIEFGLWALLSIVTAVVMILLSNKLLPANF